MRFGLDTHLSFLIAGVRDNPYSWDVPKPTASITLHTHASLPFGNSGDIHQSMVYVHCTCTGIRMGIAVSVVLFVVFPLVSVVLPVAVSLVVN